jgi:hypothetical protein
MEDIEERHISYRFITAFLLGAIFAECTSDIISDYLFFHRVSSGQPLSPLESVIYWYYLPALVYTALFVMAFVLMKKRVVKAKHFVYLMLFLAGIGTVKSYEELGGDKNVLFLLLIPFLLFTFVLLFKRKK